MSAKTKKNKKDLKPTDFLAMERTRLANERTFLAYFRTFIVFLSSGFAILKLSLLQEIVTVGYFLTVLAPIVLGIGIGRFIYVRTQLRRYFDD
ncbi:DUF202 domain-containing protein [Robiginitalea sp. M366]|uniref:DUF202 domain-containing protein n=1 Tax=Robiginitalea aestuariiviva TaxID=3036903 RepID=UPI00240E5B1E|nr:DUF202 domain-containing protein [Robiginitalea aestuariiviva]MDG1571917.1 DUF202 domain-containing protein [Robiginitalea aestuariiviva]